MTSQIRPKMNVELGTSIMKGCGMWGGAVRLGVASTRSSQLGMLMIL
jgi:hypothetical protein